MVADQPFYNSPIILGFFYQNRKPETENCIKLD
jgi:hypothetical protein